VAVPFGGCWGRARRWFRVATRAGLPLSGRFDGWVGLIEGLDLRYARGVDIPSAAPLASGGVLQRVFDLTPSMMAYWDCDLRCRAANSAYEHWFGITAEALLGRSIADLLGPRLFALNEPHIRGALRGEEQSFERIVIGPDGVARHSLARYIPDVVDGVVRGFVAHVTDVSSLKRIQVDLQATVEKLEAEAERRRTAEVSLRDSEQGLAVALASIGAGFLTTDRAGHVTRINAVAEQLLDWTQADALGRPLWEVWKRAGRQPEDEQLNPVDVMLRDGITVDTPHEVVGISRVGQRVALEVKAALTHDADGTVRGLALVFRDLTRLRASEERRRLAEERLRLVAEAAPNGLLLVDRQGKIRFANGHAARTFGWSVHELMGAPLDRVIPQRWAGSHPDRVHAFFAAPRSVAMAANRAVFARRKDGGEVAVEVSLAPLEMRDGLYALASVVDVTERNRTEQALRRSNADLEQFAYVASHDLQEPLRMVAAYTELLGRRYRDVLDERGHRYVDYAIEGARRMQRLVADVLAYSRLGSQHSTEGEVSSEVVVERVLGMLRPSIADCRATILLGELPAVRGDALQLEQLFQNLLRNALKFRSDRPLVVVIAAALRDDSVEFRVEDNGIGFDMAYQDRVFQMFQRLHERGAYEGSGIGLAIVKRIVERHDGQISVRSVPGQGTCFSFTLPPALVAQ
jgi:PAS domain S-box-containing protein